MLDAEVHAEIAIEDHDARDPVAVSEASAEIEATIADEVIETLADAIATSAAVVESTVVPIAESDVVAQEAAVVAKSSPTTAKLQVAMAQEVPRLDEEKRPLLSVEGVTRLYNRA